MKPVFGGKAHATYRNNAFPQVASIRQGSFAPAPYADPAGRATIPMDLALDSSRARTRIVEKVQDEDPLYGPELCPRRP